MALTIPAYCTDQSYPFSTLRLQMGSLISAGVVKPTDMVVSASSGLQVSIAAGQAYVKQTSASEGSAYNGLYYEMNDAPASPYNSIAAPIANPRVDTVVLRIYDIVEQSLSGSSFARFEWVEGSEVAGASLTNLDGIAALPTSSLALAYVLQEVGESSISPSNILNVAPLALTNGWLNNRVQVSSGANVTMNPGVLYESLGGNSTFTLPHLQMGILVGVFQGGSGVITVQTSDSSPIHGVGLQTGITNFQLGTLGSSALLFCDGAQWFVVSGKQNTGWQSLTLGTNVTSVSGYTPSARIEGDVVRFKGSIQASSGISTGATIFTLPSSAMYPANSVLLDAVSAGGGSSSGVILSVSTSGVGSLVVGPGWTSLYVIPLNGLSFTLS